MDLNVIKCLNPKRDYRHCFKIMLKKYSRRSIVKMIKTLLLLNSISPHITWPSTGIMTTIYLTKYLVTMKS